MMIKVKFQETNNFIACQKIKWRETLCNINNRKRSVYKNQLVGTRIYVIYDFQKKNVKPLRFPTIELHCMLVLSEFYRYNNCLGALENYFQCQYLIGWLENVFF
jgi:hypothetical protein